LWERETGLRCDGCLPISATGDLVDAGTVRFLRGTASGLIQGQLKGELKFDWREEGVGCEITIDT
jgi:hypothetical protein